ncbi:MULTISPECIES: hypothetical protein [unclassified Streptomyces]|uniref:hypothetical protein n=1 Tax=unclassified Streptomyces TaxID=2593676 RepID=UPI0033ADFDA3
MCRYSDAAAVGEREVPFRAGEANGGSSAELTAAGSAISAGSSLVDYHPYYNGLVPAQQKALSAQRDTGTAAPRAGTAAAPQPDLDAVRTTNR